MRKIESREDLEIGTFLLWNNKGSHREVFGDFTVIELVSLTINEYPVDDYCGVFKFPDNDVPQQLSFEFVQKNCKILDPEEDVEWLI